MATRDNEELRFALRDISTKAPSLKSPFDRVKCAEWARKLAILPDDDLETSKLKNDYAQYLRIQVRNNLLHGIFKSPPSPTAPLIPLAEALGSLIRNHFPNLPSTGPIAPVLTQRSPDGRAVISTKKIPGGGVFCYLAVTPDGFE